MIFFSKSLNAISFSKGYQDYKQRNEVEDAHDNEKEYKYEQTHQYQQEYNMEFDKYKNQNIKTPDHDNEDFHVVDNGEETKKHIGKSCKRNEDGYEQAKNRKVSDEDEESRKERLKPQPVCRFYSKGQCTWGASCRFVHPGVLDKGNYNMFAPPRPILPGNINPCSIKRLCLIHVHYS